MSIVNESKSSECWTSQQSRSRQLNGVLSTHLEYASALLYKHKGVVTSDAKGPIEQS